ncbi:MAG TPA: peptide deformylase [bacterium]|nr:peptide deformylase [bacterium]HQG44407.1 peptide deformylase [bacterium]HQI48214.1 peptide deformylase [bacterium]HQJ64786.1 peptide deformylase [bacterium]
MAVLPVIKYGHPTLRTTARRIQPGELSETFIADMIETMEALDGVGLAATQVNVDKQLLVAKDIDHKKLYVLANPEVIAYSEKMEKDIEGCLSLPGLQGQVPRYIRIIVKAETPEGHTVEIEARGHFARVLQHEIDHLHGILYIDRTLPGSLEWIVDTGSESYSTTAATLEEIQQTYRKRYHEGASKLQFAALRA